MPEYSRITAPVPSHDLDRPTAQFVEPSREQQLKKSAVANQMGEERTKPSMYVLRARKEEQQEHNMVPQTSWRDGRAIKEISANRGPV